MHKRWSLLTKSTVFMIYILCNNQFLIKISFLNHFSFKVLFIKTTFLIKKITNLEPLYLINFHFSNFKLLMRNFQFKFKYKPSWDCDWLEYQIFKKVLNKCTIILRNLKKLKSIKNIFFIQMNTYNIKFSFLLSFLYRRKKIW